MRLTSSLSKFPIRWYFINSWKAKNKYPMPKLAVPKALLNKDVRIIDPVEMYLKPKPLAPWQPPVPDDPSFGPMTPKPEDHPDYHETPVYEVTTETRLLEGVDQASILTKTKVNRSLPQQVTDLMGAVSLPNQDELVQRYIMQANVWDPSRDKLPRRLNKRLPGWHFKAEWGTREHKKVKILLSGMLRICNMIGGHYPDLFHTRRLLRDHYNAAYYYYNGDNHVQIRSQIGYMTASSNPLPAVADEDEIDATVSHDLPDIYPISPLVDVEKQHIYHNENNTGVYEGYPFPHPHTIYLPLPDICKPAISDSKALLHTFGVCLAQAKHRFGSDIKNLPEPITAQCVYTNGEKFTFLVFQLNTLNMDTQDGVKNIAWLDSDNYLYRKIIPERAMLRNTRYEDYDSKVLEKFIALHAHGADLTPREQYVLASQSQQSQVEQPQS